MAYVPDQPTTTAVTEALLVSPDFVRAHTAISDNVDGKYIKPAIRKAQDMQLRIIIGDTLTDRLIAMVADGTIGEHEYYNALLVKAQYYLTALAAMEVIPKVAYKIGNFGVMRASDENLQAASSQEIDREIQRYQDEADQYCLMLENWILNNRAEFPELCEGDVHRIHSHLYTAASCGINLGGARGKIIRGGCK